MHLPLKEHLASVVLMSAAALIAGLGHLLSHESPLTWRIVVGRAMTSCALGIAAGTVLLFFPDASFPALTGIAALLGSLGTSGIERLVQAFLQRSR